MRASHKFLGLVLMGKKVAAPNFMIFWLKNTGILLKTYFLGARGGGCHFPVLICHPKILSVLASIRGCRGRFS